MTVGSIDSPSKLPIGDLGAPSSAATQSHSMTQIDHTFVFIGGLHRSGTSLVSRCLADHPATSGFHDTGAPEDEGQHLQSVFPRASAYGGPGKFGFAQAMHLTESSSLVTAESRRLLREEWSRHWDTTRTHLVEKSPPNLIKARFLQAMFPSSSFVFILRHPVAVAGATKKWKRRTPLAKLVEHWVVCHEIMRADLGHLHRAKVIHYEHLVMRPAEVLADLFRFVGLEPVDVDREVRSNVNESYFAQWESWKREFFNGRSIRKAQRHLEERISRFGYSLVDLRADLRSPSSTP